MNPEVEIEGIIENFKLHVNPGLARLMQFGGFGDVEDTAEGCVITTLSGEKYLDFVGGFGVFSLGHRHPKVVEAVQKQLLKMPLSTRTFFNEAQSRLAAKLAEIAPGDLKFTFFSNSGAEAVEAALKFARIATGKTDFISTIGAYHGKTMGSLAATGREKYRKPFEPMIPGFSHVPFDDLQAMSSSITEKTAAIIIEPIQGEGGIITPKAGYLAGLRELCDRHKILLIVDEVQTGLGRTGKMFGVDHEGVAPDILCLAKALGGGVMPIGATMATPEIWERTFGDNPLIHTSTFGGNQLACVAGFAAIEATIEEGLADRAEIMGNRLISGLRKVQESLSNALVEVRGQGLMIGIEFSLKDVAELTINGMARRGIIAAYTLNNPKVIRMEPPLIVTPNQIDTVLIAFQESVVEAVQMLEGLEE